MNLDLYIAFVVSTAVLILIPGPLVVAHSLAHGSRRALVTVAGSGLRTWLCIAGRAVPTLDTPAVKNCRPSVSVTAVGQARRKARSETRSRLYLVPVVLEVLSSTSNGRGYMVYHVGGDQQDDYSPARLGRQTGSPRERYRAVYRDAISLVVGR